MDRIQSLQFWSILGPNLLPENQKILQKTRFSAKTTYRPTYLGISNNVSLKSQESHIILVKLSKKLGRGGTNWV